MSTLVLVLHQGQKPSVLLPCNSTGYIHTNRPLILREADKNLCDGYRLALIDTSGQTRYISDVVPLDKSEPGHNFLYLRTGKVYETMHALISEVEQVIKQTYDSTILFGTCTKFSRQSFEQHMQEKPSGKS